MNSCSYFSVEQRVLALCGLPPRVVNFGASELLASDVATINKYINRRLRQAWTFWWWPELMRSEQRAYRLAYASGTAYVVTNEVYFPATQKYYQALRSTTGNAPATLSGSTWSTNSAYWAECAESYSGSDWADGTAYAVGDVVRSYDDGLYYSCHTAHTASSSIDASKFGQLTVFQSYVSYTQTGFTELGAVRGMYWDDPHLVGFDRARRIDWHLTNNGPQTLNEAPARPWVAYRLRPYEYIGSDFSASATYASGITVYYSSATAGYEGDFWTSSASTSAGEDPEDTPAKWTKVEFPKWLREAVAQAAYADWLRGDEANQIASIEDTPAAEFLAHEVNQLTCQQGQILRMRVA